MRDAEVHRIDRGGSFTFHGPGQLVGYPILDLGATPDAAAHLRRMEEVVIRAAADIDVELERRPDVQTGVWSGDRKVCAIGVRLMRARVTLHGFAINCDTDLSWFDGIVACGLPDHGVTSLSELAGRDVTVSEMRPIVERHLARRVRTFVPRRSPDDVRHAWWTAECGRVADIVDVRRSGARVPDAHAILRESKREAMHVGVVAGLPSPRRFRSSYGSFMRS